MKNVVTIGGGTGSYTVLRGLKQYDDLNITAVVSMADDGGSTGILRDELGVLPPGDVRQCLVALSEHDDVVRALISYRFAEGTLKGHSFGNILLAALEKVAGSFSKGVKIASDILKIKGTVIPVTEDNATLLVTLADGSVLQGEDTINHTNIQSVGVASLGYEKSVTLSQAAHDAILQADSIIIGPGNLYCSILPILTVVGCREAIQASSAKIIVPVNLTNKRGHTEHFNASNYVSTIETAIGKRIDHIMCNSGKPSDEQIELYRIQEGDGVLVDNDYVDDARVTVFDVLSHEIPPVQRADAIATVRSFIRHDSKKLANVIHSLL